MQSFFYAEKRRIFKSFIESQFKYCPWTWIFCSQERNNKISRLNERCLRIVNNDYKSACEELLSNYHSFSIHDQNIHCLDTKIYKVVNDLSVGPFEKTFRL